MFQYTCYQNVHKKYKCIKLASNFECNFSHKLFDTITSIFKFYNFCYDIFSRDGVVDKPLLVSEHKDVLIKLPIHVQLHNLNL